MQRVVTLTLVVPVMAGMVLPPIGFCLIPPNRQDQRGQQDWWGRLKLKTPLEWGPAGVGHGGGCGSSRDELRGATAQPTGPNTPSIAASKKTISERPGADVHSLACLLYSH